MKTKSRVLFPMVFLSVALFIATSCNFVPTGKRVAYLYGISKYIDADPEGIWPNLRNSDDDANSVEELFINQGYDSVIKKIDSDATKLHILTDISSAAASLGPNDSFLLYYSGHGGGVSDTTLNTYVIVPYGGFNQTKTINTAGLITREELLSSIEKISCTAKTVLLDSCNSGGFVDVQNGIDLIPSNFNDQLDPNPSVFKFPDSEITALALSAACKPSTSGNGIMVLSASGSEEAAIENSSIGHGYFTYFLLKAPQNADFNQSGYVTVSEAWRFIGSGINKSWNAYYVEVGRNPLTGDFYPHISGGDTDFILF